MGNNLRVKVPYTDPVYPVYLNTNVIAGRIGKYNKQNNQYENVEEKRLHLKIRK